MRTEKPLPELTPELRKVAKEVAQITKAQKPVTLEQARSGVPAHLRHQPKAAKPR